MQRQTYPILWWKVRLLQLGKNLDSLGYIFSSQFFSEAASSDSCSRIQAQLKQKSKNEVASSPDICQPIISNLGIEAVITAAAF